MFTKVESAVIVLVSLKVESKQSHLPELWASYWPPHRNEECGPHTVPRSQAPEKQTTHDADCCIYCFHLCCHNINYISGHLTREKATETVLKDIKQNEMAKTFKKLESNVC